VLYKSHPSQKSGPVVSEISQHHVPGACEAAPAQQSVGSKKISIYFHVQRVDNRGTMRAVAYIRWSSDEQSSGNSLERQSANVRTYCERHGLVIAETIIDNGFSAFKGEHISRGKLGQFLEAAATGRYRGFALVVEQTDRLSRLGINDTLALTNRILAAGVTIHVSQQNRVFAPGQEDLGATILNVVEAHSAAEYSRKLRERISRAWKSKQQGECGIAMTAQGPGWLICVKGQPITVDEGRAAVVRRIFSLCNSGFGQIAIANMLNREGVPTFGSAKNSSKRWTPQNVRNILVSRATIGGYQPREAGKDVGEERAGFYPAVIDVATFHEAQNRLKDRRMNAKGGRNGIVQSLFTSLVYDDLGTTMHYSSKGSGALLRLVSYAAPGQQRSCYYEDFEAALLTFFDSLDWRSVLGVAESEGLRRAEQEVSACKANIVELEQRIERITDLLIDTPSSALKTKLIDAESKLESERATLVVAERALEETSRKNADMLSAPPAFLALYRTEDIQTRAKLRDEIRKKVQRIDMLSFEQEKCARVIFASGAVRHVKWVRRKVDGWTKVEILTEKETQP